MSHAQYTWSSFKHIFVLTTAFQLSQIDQPFLSVTCMFSVTFNEVGAMVSRKKENENVVGALFTTCAFEKKGMALV